MRSMGRSVSSACRKAMSRTSAEHIGVTDRRSPVILSLKLQHFYFHASSLRKCCGKFIDKSGQLPNVFRSTIFPSQRRLRTRGQLSDPSPSTPPPDVLSQLKKTLILPKWWYTCIQLGALRSESRRLTPASFAQSKESARFCRSSSRLDILRVQHC